jgi:hypothetical protein
LVYIIFIVAKPSQPMLRRVINFHGKHVLEHTADLCRRRLTFFAVAAD